MTIRQICGSIVSVNLLGILNKYSGN